MKETFQPANQIRTDDYERDLGRINMPLVFLLETCRLSWKDRMAVADAILANNMAYRGMAKERDMMQQDRTAGSAQGQQSQPERSLSGVSRG